MGIGGFSHWIIILIIVLVIFGAGRVSNVMGELGKGIKSFKEGMADDEEEKYRRYEERRRAEEQQRQLPRDESRREPIDVTPRPAEPVPPAKDGEAR